MRCPQWSITQLPTALLQRLALGLCLEEGAAWCLLLVCTNPALVHLCCLPVLPHSTALETCPPCDKWEGLDHAESDPIQPWAQHRRLPSRGAWAGPRAEAVEAVRMQGWQLAGGWGSPHSFYFCCLCHMDATTTDDVIGLVPPRYFCIDLWVCVAEPLPALRVLHGSGLPMQGVWWVLLTGTSSTTGLMGTGLFSEAPSHLWRCLGFFEGRKCVKMTFCQLKSPTCFEGLPNVGHLSLCTGTFVFMGFSE